MVLSYIKLVSLVQEYVLAKTRASTMHLPFLQLCASRCHSSFEESHVLPGHVHTAADGTTSVHGKRLVNALIDVSYQKFQVIFEFSIKRKVIMKIF